MRWDRFFHSVGQVLEWSGHQLWTFVRWFWRKSPWWLKVGIGLAILLRLDPTAFILIGGIGACFYAMYYMARSILPKPRKKRGRKRR